METEAIQQSSDLDGWDPMVDDYQDPAFNSYDTGPGKDLPPQPLIAAGPGEIFTLYVVGIPNELNEEGLKNLFSDDGQLNVLSANKIKSKHPEKGDTFGFVKYGTVGEAAEAIRKFNQYKIGPFTLRVKVALSDNERMKRKKEKQEEEEFFNSLNVAKSESSQRQKVEDEKAAEESRMKRIQSQMNQSKAEFVMNLAQKGSQKHTVVNGNQLPGTDRCTPVDLGYQSGETQNQTTPKSMGGDGDHSREHSLGYVKDTKSPTVPDQAATGTGDKCTYCREKGHLKCGACKSPYCSAACQREDWREHKQQCKKIREIAELAERFDVTLDDELQHLVGELPKLPAAKPTSSAKFPLQRIDERTSTMPASAGVKKYMSEKMARVSLPLNEKCTVKILDITNPSDFCVMFPENASFLFQLIENMNKHYDNTTNAGPSAYVPSVGELCAVQFAKDNGWYRAEVEEILLNGMVKVRYQDFGNVEERSVAYTRKLLPEFTELPLQGIRCCLTGIAPLEGQIWTDLVTSELKTVVVAMGEVFDVICEQVVSGISHLQLITKDGGNVGEALVYQQMARQVAEVLKSASPLESPRIEIDYPDQPPVTSSANSCTLEETCKNIQQTALDEIKVGEPFAAAVFHVESSDVFFVHHIEKSFLEMSAIMNDAYNKMPDNQTFRPQPGGLAAAKWEGAWYRALVLANLGSTSKVFYLDYGNTEEVKNAGIHPLLEEFANHPPKSIKCGLAGVHIDSNDPQVSHSVKLKLKEKLEANTMSITLVTAADSKRALVNVTLGDGTDLGHLLINNGLARPAEATQIKEIEDHSYIPHLLPAESRESPVSSASPILPTVTRGARSPLTCISSELSLPRLTKAQSPVSGARSPIPVTQSPSSSTGARKTRSPLSPRSDVIGARSPLNIITQTKSDKHTCGAKARPKCFTKKDIPKLDLPMDREFPMLLVHCISPGEFYICFPDHIEKIGELEEKVQKCASRDDEHHVPQVDEVVLALFTDGVWYRAEVVADLGQQRGYQVYFSDYGNAEIVKASNIRKIRQPELVQAYPRQAYQCKLHGVKDIDAKKSEAAAAEIKKIKPGTISVKVVQKRGDTYSVDLTSEEGDSLAKHLIARQLMTAAGLVPHPDSAFQPIQPAVQTQVSPSRSRIMRDDVPAASLQTPSTMVIVCNPEGVSPKEFYCWNMSKEQEIEEVVALKDRLGDFYEHIQPDPAYRPLVNEMCVTFVKGEDGGWSRAVVQAVMPNNKYKVFYVDFGQEDVVKREELYPLDRQFTKLPVQAIKCGLSYCIHSVNQNFSSQVMEKFKELVLQKILEAKLMTKEKSTFYIDLFDPKTKGNIGSELIKSHADLATGDQGRADQQQRRQSNDFQQSRKADSKVKSKSPRGNTQGCNVGNRQQDRSGNIPQERNIRCRNEDCRAAGGGDAETKAFIDQLNQGGRQHEQKKNSPQYSQKRSPDKFQKQGNQKSPGGNDRKQKKSPGRNLGHTAEISSSQQQSAHCSQETPSQQTSYVSSHGQRDATASMPQMSSRMPSDHQQPQFHSSSYSLGGAAAPVRPELGRNPIDFQGQGAMHEQGYTSSVSATPMRPQSSCRNPIDFQGQGAMHEQGYTSSVSATPMRPQSSCRNPIDCQAQQAMHQGYGRGASATPVPQQPSQHLLEPPVHQAARDQGYGQHVPIDYHPQMPLEADRYDAGRMGYYSQHYQPRGYESAIEYLGHYRGGMHAQYPPGNYRGRGGYRAYPRGGGRNYRGHPPRTGGLEEKLDRMLTLLEPLFQQQQHQSPGQQMGPDQYLGPSK